jgi:hypothetical protein
MEKAEHSQVYPVMRRRAECLAMLLKWRGATLADNEIEKKVTCLISPIFLCPKGDLLIQV